MEDTIRDCRKCKHFTVWVEKISWEDGLGSPGHITIEQCTLFNKNIVTTVDRCDSFNPKQEV